jgi:hypothetical protein
MFSFQFFIGMSFLAICLNITLSIDKKYEILKNEPQAMLTRLEIMRVMSDGKLLEKEELPFTKDDLKWIEDNFSEDLKFAYIIWENSLWGKVNGEYSVEMPVLYTNAEFFDLFYPEDDIYHKNKNSENSDENAYLAQKAYDYISGEADFGNNQSLFKKITSNEIILNNNISLPVKILSGIDDKRVFRQTVAEEHGELHFNSLIILPIEFYEEDLLKYSSRFLYMKFLNTERQPYIMAEIYNRLSERSEYEYSFTVEAEDYLHYVSGYKEILSGLQALSITALLIIIIGLASLLNISINNRMKDFLVSIAVGAKKSVICFEILIEAGFLTFSTGILSMMFSVIYISYFIPDLRQFTVNANPVIFISTLLVCLIVSGLSSIFPVYKVMKSF